MMMYIVGFAAEDMEGKTEEEIEMMKMMGFDSFDSSKVRARRHSDAHVCLFELSVYYVL